MSFPFLAQAGEVLRLRIQAQPNASKNQIVGVHGEALKVKIKAPPENGRANEELISFLAETLRLPRRSLHLVAGSASRAKVVEIQNLSLAEAEASLARILG